MLRVFALAVIVWTATACSSTCQFDRECGDDEVCASGTCAPRCRADTDCESGSSCARGRCKPAATPRGPGPGDGGSPETPDSGRDPSWVTVRAFEGGLPANLAVVVFHDRDGEPVHVAWTGPDGVATAKLPEGGMVTRVGGSRMTPHHATVTAVPQGAELSFGWRPEPQTVRYFPYLLELPSFDSSRGASLTLFQECFDVFAMAPSGHQPLKVPVFGRACSDPSARWSALLISVSYSQRDGYSYYDGFSYLTDISQTSTVGRTMPSMRRDFEPIELTLTNVAPGEVLRAGLTLQRGDVPFGGYPIGTATAATDALGTARATVNAIPDFADRYRRFFSTSRVQGPDVTTSEDVVPVARAADPVDARTLLPHATSVTKVGAEVSWVGDFSSADEIVVVVRTNDSFSGSWTYLVPPTAARVRKPRLPAEIALPAEEHLELRVTDWAALQGYGEVVRLRDHYTGLWRDGRRVELGDKRTSVHYRSP
jgi:hypothetical protein